MPTKELLSFRFARLEKLHFMRTRNHLQQTRTSCLSTTRTLKNMSESPGTSSTLTLTSGNRSPEMPKD